MLSGAWRHLYVAGLPVAPHPADRATRALWTSAQSLNGTVREAAARLSAARQELGSLASLADGAPAAEAHTWRNGAFCDIVASAPRPQDSAAVLRRRHRQRMRQEIRHGGRKTVSASLRAAARALLPRLRRWSAELRLPDETVEDLAATALAAAAVAPPRFGVALLRTWVDGWPTPSRRGLRPRPCAACGVPGGDGMRHGLRCATAARIVSRVSGVPRPASWAEAMALVPPHHRPPVRSGRTAPPLPDFFHGIGRRLREDVPRLYARPRVPCQARPPF